MGLTAQQFPGSLYNGAVKPYQVAVPDAVLDDLHSRLARTRLPNEISDIGWEQGTARSYLAELLDHWLHRYDWRATEARVNQFEQFITEVDDQQIHVLHIRSPNPSAVPLLLVHGWPGSIMEFMDVFGPLSETFHIIAPSLPGFTFSGPTSAPGWHPRRIAGAFAEVLQRLGYERYGLQGGDWGSLVCANVADLHPDRVIGLHLNMVTAAPRLPDAVLTEDEEEKAEAARQWRRTGVGYQEIQGTKPQSLGYGLEDSPAGLAGWIVEKFQEWSFGDIREAYTFDRLLDNVTAYWVTGTATSSLRIYWEMRKAGRAALPERRREVPTAVANFPGEVTWVPRARTEAAYNVVRWSEPSGGGHFAAMEAPAEFVSDVREFFSHLDGG